MMAVPGGAMVAVEVEGEPPPPPVNRGRGAADAAIRSFDDALSGLRGIATSLEQAVRDARPDSTTVTFGLDFSAETGVIIASGRAGASLSITMTWNGTPG
ncbi:MAG: CU044_2847 family protein [Gemmatimonadales bacterium]